MANPYKQQAISSENAKQKSLTGKDGQNAFDKALKMAGVTGLATMPPVPDTSTAQFEIDRPADAPEYGSVRLPEDQD